MTNGSIRLKRLASVKGRIGWHGLSTDDYGSGDCILVTGTEVSGGKVEWELCNRVSDEIWSRDPWIQLAEGDVLVTKDGTIGKVAQVADLPTKATLNSGVFRVTSDQALLNPRFLFWTLKSSIFDHFVGLLGSGSTISHLYQRDFVDFEIPSHSLPLQRAIADHLDTETTRIDALIEKKWRMTELIDQRLRTQIEAVMMTSNDEPTVMIGKLLQLKITDGPHESPEFVDDGVPFLSIEAIKNDRLVFDGCRRISEASHCEYARKCNPRRDDVLLAKTGATIGKVVLVETNQTFSIWSPLALIRPRNDVLRPKFVWYWLRSPSIQSEIRVKATQSTQPNISMPDIATLRIPLKSLADQDAIVKKLDELERRSYELTARIGRQTDCLIQHRQALITAAVTGELNIEGIAA